MSNCFTCGGYGFKDKICPDCGFDRNSLNLNTKSDIDLNKFSDKSRECSIPDSYIGCTWSRGTLENSHSSLMKDLRFKKYCEQLDKIHNIFIKGFVPNKSFMLLADSNLSKTVFAFSCMQYALNNGWKVAPFLDTMELKRLLVLSAENPKYRLYDKIYYDSYINSDVIFISVTKTDYRKEAYSIILEIIDRRSRMGKPTFIISRYSFKEISERDYIKEFESIKDVSGINNSLKYPAIISYSERGV